MVAGHLLDDQLPPFPHLVPGQGIKHSCALKEPDKVELRLPITGIVQYAETISPSIDIDGLGSNRQQNERRQL